MLDVFVRVGGTEKFDMLSSVRLEQLANIDDMLVATDMLNMGILRVRRYAHPLNMLLMFPTFAAANLLRSISVSTEHPSNMLDVLMTLSEVNFDTSSVVSAEQFWNMFCM